MEKKKLLTWMATGVASVLCFTMAVAGYGDPVSLNTITFSTNIYPAAIDFDNDADMDVLVGEASNFRLFENVKGRYKELTGGDNPFSSITLLTAAPAFIDLDGDGDIDLSAGCNNGIVQYYEAELGTYDQLGGTDNPFSGFQPTTLSKPEFADIDGDGDMDLVVGYSDGAIYYLSNEDGVHTEQTGDNNPFNGIDVGSSSDPTLVDLDDDGDLDLIVGNNAGLLLYFENIDGTYTEQTGTDNPFDGFTFGTNASPVAVDTDGDGDEDILVGDDSGINYLRNSGGAFTQLEGTGNPFVGLPTGTAPYPVFADYDNDGHDELLVGHSDGSLSFFENDGVSLYDVDPAENPFSAFSTAANATPALGDVDDDGDLDLLIGNGAGTLQYYINYSGIYEDVTGTEDDPFKTISNIAGNTAPAFYNYDGDAYLDLFVGIGDGSVECYQNLEGDFYARTGAQNIFDGVNAQANARLKFQDIDRDGDLDMITGNNTTNAFMFFMNNDTAFNEVTGTENPFININANWPSPSFYDMNNDGYDDFVYGTYSAGLYISYYTPPGVNVQSEPVLNTTEKGGMSIIALSLKSKPTTDVIVKAISSDESEGKAIDPNAVIFTTTNWKEKQYIPIVGQDDHINDAGKSYQIEFLVLSDDREYDSIPVASLPAINADDDGPSALNAYTTDDIKIFAYNKVINIESAEAAIERVEVYSISGSLMENRTAHTEGRYELSMEGANAGIYIVRVLSNGKVTNAKVIIQ